MSAHTRTYDTHVDACAHMLMHTQTRAHAHVQVLAHTDMCTHTTRGRTHTRAHTQTHTQQHSRYEKQTSQSGLHEERSFPAQGCRNLDIIEVSNVRP